MRKVDPVKFEQKRQLILEAAGKCFVRDGFRGASISDICAEAKISPGHLYHYFASKEAIVGSMIEDGLKHAGERISRLTQSADPVTAMLDGIDSVLQHSHYGRRRLLLDMLVEAGRNKEIGRIVRESSRKARALLADFLRIAQEHGQVDRTLDADMAAAILMSVLDGAKTLEIRDPAIDAAGSAELLKILISRFLAHAPGRGSSDEA